MKKWLNKLKKKEEVKEPLDEVPKIIIESNSEWAVLKRYKIDEVREKYKEKIGITWDNLRSVRKEEKGYVFDHTITKLIETIGNLPASNKSHHNCEWGLFSHTLEVAIKALVNLKAENKKYRNADGVPDNLLTERSRRKDNIMVFMGAILHDIGKIFDFEIQDGDGIKFDPYIETLYEWLNKKKRNEYKFRWVPGRGSDHNKKGLYLIQKMFDIRTVHIIGIDRYVDIIEGQSRGLEVINSETCKYVHEADKASAYEYKVKLDKVNSIQLKEEETSETETQASILTKDANTEQTITEETITQPKTEEVTNDELPFEENKSEPENKTEEVVGETEEKTEEQPEEEQTQTPSMSLADRLKAMETSEEELEDEIDEDSIVGVDARGAAEEEQIENEEDEVVEEEQQEEVQAVEDKPEDPKPESEPQEEQNIEEDKIQSKVLTEQFNPHKVEETAKDWDESYDFEEEFLRAFKKCIDDKELNFNKRDGDIWVGNDYTMLLTPQSVRKIIMKRYREIQCSEGVEGLDLESAKKSDRGVHDMLNKIGVVFVSPEDGQSTIHPIKFRPNDGFGWYKKQEKQDFISVCFIRNDWLWKGLEHLRPSTFSCDVVRMGFVKIDGVRDVVDRGYFTLTHTDKDREKIRNKNKNVELWNEMKGKRQDLEFDTPTLKWVINQFLMMFYQYEKWQERDIKVNKVGGRFFLTKDYLVVIYPGIIHDMNHMEGYTEYRWPMEHNVQNLIDLDNLRDDERLFKIGGYVQRRFHLILKNTVLKELGGLVIHRDKVDQNIFSKVKTMKLVDIKFIDETKDGSND